MVAKVHPKPSRTGQTSKSWLTQQGDRLAFNWKIRRALYKHLSAQIANDVQVEKALDAFRPRLKRAGRKSSDKIIADVARRMRDGSTLTKSLAPWIPQDEVGIISAGEQAGQLAKSLDLLISAKERTQRVVKAMRNSLKKPAFYVCLIYAFVWYLAAYVFPDLRNQQPQSAHPTGAVAALFALGDLATSFWAVLPPILLAGLVGAVIWSLPRWIGPARIRAERFFPYSAYRDVHGYGWLMSYTAMLGAGVADVDILKRQCETASPWLRERLHAFWWRMEDGARFPTALLAKGKGRNGMPPFGFPNPEIVDDIGSMAGFDDFEERITQVAKTWSDELEEDLVALADRIGFWAETIMLSIVTFLLYAINTMSTASTNMPNF